MRGSILGACYLAPRLLRPWHGPTTPSRTRRQGRGHSWQAGFRTKSRSASHSGSLSLSAVGPGAAPGASPSLQWHPAAVPVARRGPPGSANLSLDLAP